MTRLVSIQQSIDILQVSRTKIYHLIGAGELVRANIGGRAFITRESIDALVDRVIAAAS